MRTTSRLGALTIKHINVVKAIALNPAEAPNSQLAFFELVAVGCVVL